MQKANRCTRQTAKGKRQETTAEGNSQETTAKGQRQEQEAKGKRKKKMARSIDRSIYANSQPGKEEKKKLRFKYSVNVIIIRRNYRIQSAYAITQQNWTK